MLNNAKYYYLGPGESEQVGLESLAEAGERLLTSARSLFHHFGARTEKIQFGRAMFVLSEGGTNRLAEVVAQIAPAGVWGLTNVWR